MTTTIYILKLNDNKYYVGKTNKTVNERYKEHIDGVGSFWTKKYKPLSIIKQIENSSPFDEDRYVKEYMAIYGIENVRGGSYLDIELSYEQKKTLQAEIYTSQNKCYLCGGNHNHKKCPNKIIIEPTNTSKHIEINKNTFKKPVVINDYVYYITCCICEKNAVGKINYTKFDYLITSPSCFDENQDIKTTLKFV